MDRLNKVIFKAKLDTDGSGFWSSRRASVRITHLQVPYINDEGDFGELCVYFDRRCWNIEQHGLIYTDTLWAVQLRLALAQAGFNASDVYYSEQGMQGDDYVSLDVGPEFLTSWLTAHTVVVA